MDDLEPIYDSSYRNKGMDIVALARDYLAKNAAESGADTLIADLVGEVKKLRDALQAAETADQQAANCEEHAPEMAPESCGECFPLADDARMKRRAALGINQPVN